VRSLATVAVTLVALVVLLSGCGVIPFGANLPRAAGCAALDFPDRRCRAIVERARGSAPISGRQVIAATVLPPPPPDDRLGGWMVARVQFDFADGQTDIEDVWCRLGSGDDLACDSDPKIRLSSRIDRDVPCAREAPNGCATLPPTPGPAAIAAAQPLRVAVLDIPLDHTGKYEVKVGSASLPNGYLGRREFDVADVRPTTFWIAGGILLDVRSTVPGRPPIGSIYREGFKGTEPVDVFLTFDVTETSPGAVLQVRELVVQ
jgi:hypothetical protein